MSKTLKKKVSSTPKRPAKTSARTKSATSTKKPVSSAAAKKQKLVSVFSHKAKIYHIIWRDAFSEVDEWHDIDSVDSGDYLCETVGYLIEDNNKEEYYTIASTMTQDDFFSCVINIPKSMVLSKKRIQFKN